MRHTSGGGQGMGAMNGQENMSNSDIRQIKLNYMQLNKKASQNVVNTINNKNYPQGSGH